MPLATIGQEDYSLGMFRGVARHLIPASGLYDALNGLLDDDGSLYRRGGSEYLSNAAFGVGLRWLWDGILTPGARTVFASATKFGVLAADDATPVDLGGAGLAEPRRAAGLAGVLFLGGGSLYGGSRKAADYAAGSADVTNGSKTVTGTGTAWTANVDAGMLLRIGGGGRYYVVETVDSDTQITLTEPYEAGTAAGVGYTLTRLGTAYRVADHYATVSKRVLAGVGRRVYYSEFDKPHSWLNHHELPAGSEVLGVEAARDVAVIFSTSGVYAIYNIAQEQVDFFGAPQHRLEALTRDIVLWGAPGIASWETSLLAPAIDGLWLLDGRSAPVRLTRSIDKLWRDYVRAGHKPGGAVVYRNHYLLPVLNATNDVVDVLACRLDRRQDLRGFGSVWPWTRLGNSGANAAAYTQRVGAASAARQPQLLAAGRAASSRVMRCSGYFEPSAARKSDADGVAHAIDWIGRDYPTGAQRPTLGSLNHIRRLKVRYELVAAAGDAPTLQGWYSVGLLAEGSTLWGAFLWGTGLWEDASLAEYTQLEGPAGPDDGLEPKTWLMRRDGRFVRWRLRSSDPAASLVLRSTEFFIRPRRKTR